MKKGKTVEEKRPSQKFICGCKFVGGKDWFQCPTHAAAFELLEVAKMVEAHWVKFGGDAASPLQRAALDVVYKIEYAVRER